MTSITPFFMQTDFFEYARQTIAHNNAAGKCDVAHNRGAALRCLAHFIGKEQMSFGELSPDFMARFKEWLVLQGRKESTARLYLNQLNAIYNVAAKDGLVPSIRLLQGIKATMPIKQDREILTDTELRRMRYADLSDSKPMTFARDIFLFSIYGRGISFTDIAYIKKSDVKGFSLTYTSQATSQSQVTIPWDAAMQEIADRYPSTTDYLFPFITTTDHMRARREVKTVRESIVRGLKLIATRCNLSVVPSMYMVREIYQRIIDRVSVSNII